MRRKQKEMIYELISTIDEAHEGLQGLLKHGKKSQVTNLFADCQDAAMAIGRSIDDSEGEGTEAVRHLEEYCELLYRIHEGEMGKDPFKIYKSLKKKLLAAYIQIRDHIPMKYEAVFMPYKASMWDSLESIWLAAREDEDVNCRVIAIPYYDKKPNGGFGELHIEKDLFPGYVPMTDYTEYDIEAMEPDVIFIHNPYDQYNYVTSVHPSFYSSELKKHTDMLVYVPYFISSEDGLLHEDMCLTPGVLNSNYIVLQSEKMKARYIDVLRKELNLSSEEFKKLGYDKKYLALGSPKIDKVIKTMHIDWEDLDIPQEWLDKICNS